MVQIHNKYPSNTNQPSQKWDRIFEFYSCTMIDCHAYLNIIMTLQNNILQLNGNIVKLKYFSDTVERFFSKPVNYVVYFY